MKNRIILIIFTILSLFPAFGQQQGQDSLIVSLITCWPGSEVYELCGHEAIRVRREGAGVVGMDSVWNYGTFDFNQPHFLYRFVKGETDYMLSGYPFAWFMPEYMSANRRVVEQELNLSQQEAARLLGMLRKESRPENCVYRYNYVKDNCATRIIDRIDSTTEQRVVYPDSIHYGTFRREMRAYHKDYPWYQFGIDLCLGSGIDYPLRGREEMFVPLEMMRKSANAHFADGRPLVRATRTLWDGHDDATLGPTPWWATPLAVSTILLVLTLFVVIMQYRHHTVYRWIYSLWFGLLGIVGCLLTFLVFISEHEATSPNILLLWLNPLQFVVAIGVWFRRLHAPSVAMVWVNVIILAVMLIVWPFQTQSANTAFFILMTITLLLALSYAIITHQISYKKYSTSNNEEVRNLRTGRSGHAQRGRTGRSRTAKARGRNSR